MQKINKPTRRDIHKILGYAIPGYNDKRNFGGRIKLNDVLNYKELSYLNEKLHEMFPNWLFAVGNCRASSNSCHSTYSYVTTVISFWPRPGFKHLLNCK